MICSMSTFFSAFLEPKSKVFFFFARFLGPQRSQRVSGEQEAPPDKDVGTGRAAITVSGAGVYVICYTAARRSGDLFSVARSIQKFKQGRSCKL